MRRYSLIITVLTSITACIDTAGGYRLEGYFPDRAGHTALLLHCTFHTTDTLALTTLGPEGGFSFKGKLEEPSICVLRIDHDDLLFLLDNVEITLQSDSFVDYHALRIDGFSRAKNFNHAVALDKDRINLYNATEDSLQQGIISGDSSISISNMQQRLDSLDKVFRYQVKNHVAQCGDPIAAIYLLHLLSIQQDFSYIDSIFPHIKQLDTSSVYIRQFGYRLDHAKNLLDAFVHNRP